MLLRLLGPFAATAFEPAPPAVPLPRISLRLTDEGERIFVDSYGRQRVFHGTYAGAKGPPWHPSLEEFDPRTSLVKEDFELMRSAGMNVLRLGVMWPGVEPVRGQYNETYLQIIRGIAAEAATFGIYTVADMHQDSLSERFCGEGVPLWAAQVTSKLAFPLPLAKPAEDGPEGVPTRQFCASWSWSESQATTACGSAYQNLYTNHDGLTDAWGSFWAKVASTFSNATELLGFELINEPFAGDPYSNPGRMLPSKADAILAKAYDQVAAHIRAVASEALIFFAGVTWDRTGDAAVDALPFGFAHAPGGAAFADRSVSAFHYYEPPQDGKVTGPYIRQRLSDARKINVGLFLTETGGGSSKEFKNWTYFEHISPECDRYGISWAHFGWKQFCKQTAADLNSTSQYDSFGACKTGTPTGPFQDGKVNYPLLRRLARPYAPAIAGNFTSSSFNDTSTIYTLTFTIDNAITAPTELSLPALVYPHGVAISVSPAGALEQVDPQEHTPAKFVAGKTAVFGMAVSIA
eukprot:g1139.t1